MFVGHYGVSLAAKSLQKSIPLWVLFIAVQFVDVLWAVFVLSGIEKARIVPGITATNPLDLYYMPYSHSLAAAIVWPAAAILLYRALARSSTRATVIMGAAVFSHWILDLLVHRPDLPLYDSKLKMGLGLWNLPALAFGLEAVVLLGGWYLYFKSTQAVTRGGRYAMFAFCIAMLLVQLFVFFGPPPASANAAALTALISYFAFAAVAYWLERKRA